MIKRKFGLRSSLRVYKKSLRAFKKTAAAAIAGCLLSFATRAQPPLTVAYIKGKFTPAKSKDFVKIAPKYGDKTMYLLKDAYAAFEKMATAAAKEGVRLRLISATRTFDDQKEIWENKWKKLATIPMTDSAKALKVMEFSAAPGASRHHWGTDVDLNNLDNHFFDLPEGKKIYEWMKLHAEEFGFGQPYTAGRPTGYKEERWHWSYLPIAKKCAAFAAAHLTDADLQGFSGSASAPNLQIVKRYVLGINPACL